VTVPEAESVIVRWVIFVSWAWRDVKATDDNASPVPRAVARARDFNMLPPLVQPIPDFI
jgi:hypothetical protein